MIYRKIGVVDNPYKNEVLNSRFRIHNSLIGIIDIVKPMIYLETKNTENIERDQKFKNAIFTIFLYHIKFLI